MEALKAFRRQLEESFSFWHNPFLAQDQRRAWRHGALPFSETFRLLLVLVCPFMLVVALILSRQGSLGFLLASAVSLVHLPAVLLAASLHASQAFQREEEQGTLDAVLLFPTPRPWLVWQKLVGPLLTGLRIAAYGLPLYLVCFLLGGFSLRWLLSLAVLAVLFAFPMLGPWTLSVFQFAGPPGRRSLSGRETVLLGGLLIFLLLIAGWACGAQQLPCLPFSAFLGLADRLGRSQTFFHVPLMPLLPLILLGVGLALGRILSAAAWLQTAREAEGHLRPVRQALTAGLIAGWLLFFIGYGWTGIQKGALAWLAVPRNVEQKWEQEDLEWNRKIFQTTPTDKQQADPTTFNLQMAREMERIRFARQKPYLLEGLLLLLLTGAGIAGCLWLLVAGAWRDQLEALWREGASLGAFVRALGGRVGFFLAAPVAFFLLVCLCGGVGPWAVPLAAWGRLLLTTGVTLLLCGSYGLWRILAERAAPTATRRWLTSGFLLLALGWPAVALLQPSPHLHATATVSPLVSFPLQFTPAREGLQAWYGRAAPSPVWPLETSPSPWSGSFPTADTPAPARSSRPSFPWWMAAALQFPLALVFLLAAGRLMGRPRGVEEMAQAVVTPGWWGQRVERGLAWITARYDNAVATQEWRVLLRQADVAAVSILVFGVCATLLYGLRRHPDLIPAWNLGPLGEGNRWSTALLMYLPFVLSIGALLAPVSVGGALAKEREKGTWAFVLLTPLSSGAILQGKLFGLLGSSVLLGLASLPGALLFALGSGQGASFGVLLIGYTALLSWSLLGGAAALYAAGRFRSASAAQLFGLAALAVMGLTRLATVPLLDFLNYSPTAWLMWHSLGLFVEGVAAWAWYAAARDLCDQVRTGDLDFEGQGALTAAEQEA